ncbi:hypothetical protein ACOSQ4_014204 [Xanthoceras sorbifolium]
MVSSHTTSLLGFFVLFNLFLGNLQDVASSKIPSGDPTVVPPFHVSEKDLLKFMQLGDNISFHVPALYVFGDSTVDNGNNNFLVSQAKANYPPYGVDFDTGIPTGRYTNGRNEADFIAQMVGLPFPPPYLGLSDSKNKTIRTGVNYGSGGCGVLSTGKSFLGTCLPFYKQIHYFETTLNNLKLEFNDDKALAYYLSKSLIFIDIGNVDVSNDYNDPATNISSKYTVRQYARLVSKEFSKSLKKLYRLGARKFLVNNLGAMGCIPAQVNGQKQNTLCVEETNDRAVIYNDLLSRMLPKLQSRLAGSKFVLGDAYKVLMDIVAFPTQYGISNTRNSCCIGINGNSTLPCAPNMKSCNNSNQHAFFDSFHQSEAVHFLITKRCSKESSICSPINLVDLLKA